MMMMMMLKWMYTQETARANDLDPIKWGCGGLYVQKINPKSEITSRLFILELNQVSLDGGEC